ncbi:tripartite tricarboxylate transporter substrate binding protein [Ramlibacter albus]|uniref:Tripartite tricarboxylate transporter substrate binding protein n=1 Tax=Ramlibacter albus TaxID=2079448 RepID=A0A923ME13_9BURK|nr:tripartite tricarboxylate transporter substrate binding protein [Ramlibacter albus]MBC5767846.1 tripartite tricarboxylate transporter substrate binding protein [Ramlibacter albus]
MKQLFEFIRCVVAAAALVAFAGGAYAQAWPSKPIRIIVPFSAGGGVDTLARMVGQRLSEQVGQPVVVENKPGAGGNIATAYVATQPADGYTLLIGANGLAANTTLYRNQPFDMMKDFAAVAYIGASPLILVAAPSFAPKNMQELVALAKSQPGKVTYATGGTGTSGHLASEMLKAAAQVDIAHVPYKGGTQAFVDLQSGRVDVMFIDPPLAMPQIKAQRLKAIAVGSAKRFDLLPDVPTVAESGVPGFEATVWWGFVAPGKTPPDVLAKLNAEIVKAIAHSSVKDRLHDMGVVPAAWSPEQFGRFLGTETEKWAVVIKRANIQPE